jgi:ACR3 family arsenite transporter
MPAPGPDRPARAAQQSAVLVQLPWLDRLLPVWILLAMAAGLLLGRLVPGLQGC